MKDLSLTVAADRYGLTSMRGGSLVDVELESDFATLSGAGSFQGQWVIWATTGSRRW